MSNELNALKVRRKTGNEAFIKDGKELDHNLLGFWQWAYSDLISNTMRGVLAEYIISYDLQINQETRIEWNAYDLMINQEIKLEIKSASYVQTWKQHKLSPILFDIAPTKGWDANTNEYSMDIKRQADIYIFCLLHHQEKLTLNPLNLDQWIFYLLPTAILNQNMLNQKTIRLSTLLKLKPIEAKFGEISMAINKILSIVPL